MVIDRAITLTHEDKYKKQLNSFEQDEFMIEKLKLMVSPLFLI